MQDVVTVIQAGGQYQVVIGEHVADVHEELMKQLGQKQTKKEDVKEPALKRIMSVITGAFMPTLPILCSCGVLKGLLSIFLMLGMQSDSGIYLVLNGISDAFFYFMPIYLGYNVASALKMENPYIGMTLGAVLCYPALNGVDLQLFSMKVNVEYTSTFLPVLFLVLLAAPLEKLLNKYIPKALRMVFVPILIFVCLIPIGYLVIGPVSNALSNGLGNVINVLFDFNPIIAGLLFGFGYQFMVVFGLHGIIMMTCFVSLLAGNPDPILAVATLPAFAQTAVVLAIYLKSKDKELKSAALPCIFSGIMGVTEPAIYGITLPRMKMFIVSCIGSGVSGLLVGLFGIKLYSFTGFGVIGLLGMIAPENPQIIPIILAVLSGMAVAFALGILLFKDADSPKSKNEETVNDYTMIASPMNGKILKLSEVQDKAFASEAIGKGVAIIPKDGEVRAPFDGSVAAIFPTAHAIGLKSKDGCEVLIHIGLDTVKLEGKYFAQHVNQGDSVKKGDLLITFEKEKLENEGFVLETPVVITNTQEYSKIANLEQNEIFTGENLLVAYHHDAKDGVL